MANFDLSPFEVRSEAPESDFHSLGNNSHVSESTNPFINAPSQSVLQSSQNSSDVDRLIGALSNIPFGNNNDVIKDIRHIDSFNGHGDEIVVIAKLKTLFHDFDEFFNLRSLPESQKIILLKQKLTGQAKELINHHRPTSYSGARLLLTKSFGEISLDSEKVLDILKSMKLKPNEKLKQFVMRLSQCAEIVADKLECTIQNKIIFDSLAKTFLSNFQPYVSIQTNIMAAKVNRDFETLTDVVLDLAESNPEIIKSRPNLNKNENRPNTNNTQVKRKDLVCEHCHKNGHTKAFCYALKPNSTKIHVQENATNTHQDFQ